MKENFNPKNKNADEIFKKAIETANVNFDSGELEQNYYESKYPDNTNGFEKETIDQEEKKSILAKNKNYNNEEIKSIIEKSEELEREMFKDLLVSIKEKKDQYYILEEKFKDKIDLQIEITKLQFEIQDIQGPENDLYKLEKEKIYNEKVSEWHKFTETSEYTEFESMTDIEDQINELENKFNNLLKESHHHSEKWN